MLPKQAGWGYSELVGPRGGRAGKAEGWEEAE